jgi:DNA-binding MarR family transcriptional regulator
MTLNKSLSFFIHVAKIQAIVNRKFDSGLGGLGWTEFLILHHLNQAEGQKLRRIDLAEKIGLTASGITRLLLPMEKIGLVQKEVNERDARVSLVMLASGGKRQYEESLERAGLLAEELVPEVLSKQIGDATVILCELGKQIR